MERIVAGITMFCKLLLKKSQSILQSKSKFEYFLVYYLILQGSANNFFIFQKKILKKLLNISSNFYFYLKVQSFRLIMENKFIQMAASAGHAVAYTIGPIF